MATDPSLHMVCADEECGRAFIPKLPQRIYCYNPVCRARRIARNNQAKMERVKRLKAEGKWLGHLGQVSGVGKGTLRYGAKKPITERACLKCDKMFEVPATSDDHICGDCHMDNDAMLAEFSEEALGLLPLAPIRKGPDGGEWGLGWMEDV